MLTSDTLNKVMGSPPKAARRRPTQKTHHQRETDDGSPLTAFDRSDKARKGLGKREKGERVPLDVKDGDTILFGKYSGQDIKIDGEEYLIMREDEVLGVIETMGAEKKAA